MRLLCTRVLLLLVLTLIHVDITPAARATPPVAGPFVRVGQLGGAVTAVSAAGPLAVIGEGPALSVVDLGDIAHPARRATLPLPDLVNSVQLVGTLAYAAVASQLVIVDVQDPANPHVHAMLSFGEQLRSVQVVGTRAYLVTASGQAPIVDVRAPDRPVVSAALVAASGRIFSLWVEGARAYLLTEGGSLEIVDLAGTAPSHLRSSTAIDNVTERSVVRVVDGIAYVTTGSLFGLAVGGLVLVDLRDPRGPRVRGSYQVDGDVLAVAVSGSRAYIGTDWYSGGLKVLDISDIDRPTLLADDPTFVSARDLALVGPLLLVAASSDSLRLYDTRATGGIGTATRLPSLGTPAVVRQSGGAAYVLSGASLHVVDVSDPTRPLLRGSVALPGNGTSLQIVAARAYVGFAAPIRFPGTGGLVVVDVQDGAAPRLRGVVALEGAVQSLVVTGTVAYAAYQSFALASGGASAIGVVDVGNDDAPRLQTTIGAQGDYRDVKAEGQQLYAVGFRELRVFDIRAPLMPQTLGVAPMQLTYAGGNARLQVVGGRAYVAIDKELRSYDVRAPNQPTLLGSAPLPNSANEICVVGGVVLAPTVFGLAIVSVAAGQQQSLLGVVGVPDQAVSIDSDGALAYIAARNGGLLVQRIDPALFARVLLPMVGQR